MIFGVGSEELAILSVLLSTAEAGFVEFENWTCFDVIYVFSNVTSSQIEEMEMKIFERNILYS